MPHANPFHLAGHWFKGNLHTHTTLSDGHYAPEERIRDYRERGYHFLAITDHGMVYESRSFGGDFLVLGGLEVGARQPGLGATYHFVIPEASGLPALPQDPTPQEVLALAGKSGALAILAHPYWSGLALPDLLAVEAGIIGLEVFNTVCEREIGRGVSSVHWDSLLERGGAPLGFAVDDSHTNRAYIRDVFQGWIMVKAESLDVEAILAAIRRGAFYSSSGPTIQDITLGDEGVSVRCSPAKCINFICHPPRGKQVLAEEGDELTQAEYIFRGNERYVRVECRDRLGRTAWSNPFRLA